MSQALGDLRCPDVASGEHRVFQRQALIGASQCVAHSGASVVRRSIRVSVYRVNDSNDLVSPFRKDTNHALMLLIGERAFEHSGTSREVVQPERKTSMNTTIFCIRGHASKQIPR